MPEPLKELPLFSIEDAEFIFTNNFSGEERPPYDKAGDRYFNLKLPDEAQARQMEADGWNVKWTSAGPNHPNPDEHVSEPWIKVALGFKFRAPTIFLIRDGKGSLISERTVGVLDSTEFEKVDLVVRARHHDMNGGGYKAWLAEFYGHVKMTDIGKKYAYLLDQTAGGEDPEES